ncbi:hypothetical protein CHU95_05510 [Niveispirillum lacus]|uniref:citrate synthase (unknown stereospecificity) n=1 Tax=Niveispirillum lacus TaxID=1981099 RepID=A0A255Z464_9PROT|nr:citrate synthase family protein [Niveispirillum lacus]OYQ36246.1 hypothetical protein CHU95_05510 [Niveispirillum lacus]
MSTPLTLSAKEAAAELGVSLATLYAYVSRGLIRSEATAGGRTRLYRAEDVRALVARRDRPDAAAAGDKALDWGAPVLESAVTLITGGALYYRGRDATDLAAGATLEAVAGLLWDVTEDPFADAPPPLPRLDGVSPDLDPLDRLLALLPLAAAADARAVNRTPAGLARTGARIARLMAAVLAGVEPSSLPLHQVLCRAWGVTGPGVELIRATLVLSADHELNASAFTVRCVASTGANPYAALSAGIGALRGPRHGGATARVAAVLPGLLDAPDPVAALSALLARGDELPGFGHRLYPDGDVRAAWLMKRMGMLWGTEPRFRRAMALARAAVDLAGTAASLDYALVLLADRLSLPPHAPIALFTLGRSAGWMAHYLEQARSSVLIRPRARYTGLRP